jgi:hypothetical protein
MTFFTIGIVVILLILTLWVRYEKKKQADKED